MTDHINPDPFDPASLRLSQDFGADIGVKKQLMRVPVRKPGRQDFVRVHPGEDYRLDTAVVELKEDREVYLVSPELRSELSSELYPVRLFTCINRQSVVTLWPCRLPGYYGRSNPWHETALQAAELAMGEWVRVVADMSLGGYQPYVAEGNLSEPQWPEQTFPELLRLAFGSFHIDRADHPLIARLRGLA